MGQESLHKEIHASRSGLSASIGGPSKPQAIPGVNRMRSFHIKTLARASEDLNFVETFFSLRLASNLSSHDLDPFVHAWTSLSDQGVGRVDLALKEKQLYEESDPDAAIQYDLNPLAAKKDEHDELFTKYEQANAFLKDIEDKRKYLVDGTIQVPLTGFTTEDNTLISDFSHFTMFFPSATPPATGKPKGKKHPTQFVFQETYPEDAALHFQVHSNIGTDDGKMAYGLTGTGMVSLAEIGVRVRKFLSNSDKGVELEPIEIPLVLNAVSSQYPDAKLVDSVSSPEEPSARREALYEGSLFLYVHLDDTATRTFFGDQLKFNSPVVDDITVGNFSHVAASMRMHVMRDMFPFIDKFTKDIATVTERDAKGKVVGTRGWTFDPSLPEGKNIHAPFNKGNMHTLPGFTYYHDRGMQRLPTTPFILNVSRIVLERRGMTEKEFVEYANNPVIVLDQGPDDLSYPSGGESKRKKRMVINPGFVRSLRILGEIATAFPTSMSYRGDYADLNTDAIDNYEDMLVDVNRIHHTEHASGMTRRSAGRSSHKRYMQHSGKDWEEALKIGTEMFGDGMIDRSGDCEDFAKMITRMLAGMYSSKSNHPTIVSIQSMLRRYVPFANLSSVTSASIRTAPPEDGSKGSSSSSPIGAVVVGSRKDLNAPIGAHMFASLLNKQDILKGIQRTSSRVEQLPDGSRLNKSDQTEIATKVLHKSMWRISSDSGEIVESSTPSIGKHLISDKVSTMDDLSQEEMEVFVRKWTPPLILEGTGQSNAMVNAISSYYGRLGDKVESINDTLFHVEAITRLISGKSTSSVTAKDIQENQSVFGAFIMPIENNRLIDSSPDVRISPFYRMITEMYGIPSGMTDERVTPYNLTRSQILYNKSSEKVHALDMSLALDAQKDYSDRIYGKGRNEEKNSIYGIDRVIPVQLAQRTLVNEQQKHDGRGGEEEEERHLTYGVNLTDLAHSSDNVGIIRMIKTLPGEQRIINNVMRHAAPSMAMRLSPRAEVIKARKLAKRYETILMKDIDRVVTRERYEEVPDKPVPMYIRMDWVRDRHIEDLANVLADNMYTERVTVRAESFARGHHLLRITPYMIVAGTKQLYLDSNVLSERMTSKERMNAMLQEGLENLLGQ
ncbi:MAG: hypothetical protein ACTSUE_26485 [Promethearchaeota archaeon]